jgi:molybdopterin-guanine dinucleotide biosynthesis protein A
VLERRLAARNLRLWHALGELDVAVVDLDHSLLANVNEPSDLERLVRASS